MCAEGLLDAANQPIPKQYENKIWQTILTNISFSVLSTQSNRPPRSIWILGFRLHKASYNKYLL